MRGNALRFSSGEHYPTTERNISLVIRHLQQTLYRDLGPLLRNGANCGGFLDNRKRNYDELLLSSLAVSRFASEVRDYLRLNGILRCRSSTKFCRKMTWPESWVFEVRA